MDFWYFPLETVFNIYFLKTFFSAFPILPSLIISASILVSYILYKDPIFPFFVGGLVIILLDLLTDGQLPFILLQDQLASFILIISLAYIMFKEFIKT